MKHIVTQLAVFAVLLATTGCSKTALDNMSTHSIDTVSATIKAGGEFKSGVVTGRARIHAKGDSLFVTLENFSTQPGPDLKVYLSRETDPVHFVNLGSLQSTSGDQTYRCPAGTDITQYKYVLIYCQQYKHLFGSASF